ncbi:unnamed protein product [Tuber aestivum]|uniref:Major facilitator superfamily (MFS) profile domain-containing protein n=1 Tax=Tuber aestivum TaxID=59557 RepID=A0A292Q3H7_9PEZI|nr:unnamed protein product [Tuber aestivum]
MYIITNIYFITAIAAIGGALFGFDISSMSAIIGTKQYNDFYGPNIDSDVQGGITAAMPGGSFCGALASGFLSDRMGRKYSIQIGALTWVLGSISICIAKNIPMLVLGRFTNGLAVGICSAQVPVYISEIARAEIRGRLVGCQQWAITWGIMIMFYISYGCSHMEGAISFRIPWGVQAVPGALLFIGLFFLPRSPRWLAKKDRWEEAEKNLALLHGNGDANDPYVKQEMEDIRAMVEFERRNADATFLELFKPSVINRTHIGVFTQIWSQMTGMNVMMYYITYVFAMAGLSGNNLLLSSSIQYVINVAMTVPALIWMDRWGRRKTLLVGSSLMMTWLFSNGIIMGSFGHPAPEGGVNGIKAVAWEVHGAPSKVIIANSYLFVASFAITWGPTSWAYPPELFPLRVRGKAVALCTSANWIFNFALGYFVPPAFESIKWKVYIIFGVFCAAMTVHVFFCFPETAGKSLEEIEALFQEGLPAWKTRVSNEPSPARVPRVDSSEKTDYAHDAV